MTTAKEKVLLGYNIKVGIYCGDEWTFNWEIWRAEESTRGNSPQPSQVGEDPDFHSFKTGAGGWQTWFPLKRFVIAA